MQNHKKDPEGRDAKMIARVKDEIVTKIREDNILRFGIDILVIVFFAVAILGFVISS